MTCSAIGYLERNVLEGVGESPMLPKILRVPPILPHICFLKSRFVVNRCHCSLPLCAAVFECPQHFFGFRNYVSRHRSPLRGRWRCLNTPCNYHDTTLVCDNIIYIVVSPLFVNRVDQNAVACWRLAIACCNALMLAMVIIYSASPA